MVPAWGLVGLVVTVFEVIRTSLASNVRSADWYTPTVNEPENLIAWYEKIIDGVPPRYNVVPAIRSPFNSSRDSSGSTAGRNVRSTDLLAMLIFLVGRSRRRNCFQPMF